MNNYMNNLKDKDIYAIPEEWLMWRDCHYCLCRMCMYHRKCRLCYICERFCVVRRKCRWFVPFVFSRSPYLEYYRELEQLRAARDNFEKPVL